MTPEQILLIIQGARAAITLATQVIEDMKANGKLTPEQYAAFRAEMEAEFAKPHWQPDLMTGTPPDPMQPPP